MVMVLYTLHFLFIHQILPNLITTYNRFMLLFYMVELLSELYGCSRHVPASENDCKWCLSELLIYHYFC